MLKAQGMYGREVKNLMQLPTDPYPLLLEACCDIPGSSIFLSSPQELRYEEPDAPKAQMLT